MKPSESKSSSTRLVHYVLLLVVIIVGIVSGAYITSVMGFAGAGSSGNVSPKQLLNHSGFEIGALFPLISIQVGETTRNLDEFLGTQRAIVVFLSGGCKACSDFMKAVEEGYVVPEECNLILLAPDAKDYGTVRGQPVLEISQEILDEYGVVSFPTIVGVDRQAKIRFVSSGYMSQLNREFFDSNL